MSSASQAFSETLGYCMLLICSFDLSYVLEWLTESTFCNHKEFKIPFLVLYLPQIIWQMYDLFKYLLLQYYQWATRILIFDKPVNTTSQKHHEKNYTWWNIYIHVLFSIGCFKIIGKHNRDIVRFIFISIETIKLYWLLFIAPVSSFLSLSFGNVKQ